MSSTVQAILEDLASALRDQATLAEVTVGSAPGSTAVPRAAVHADGLTLVSADDAPDVHWARLRVRIVLHTTGPEHALLASELEDLAEQARQAVLADPFRQGLCRHLPIGQATEVGEVEPQGAPRHPNGEITLALRCHFEIPEAQP